jgi:hypothetical protein
MEIYMKNYMFFLSLLSLSISFMTNAMEEPRSTDVSPGLLIFNDTKYGLKSPIGKNLTVKITSGIKNKVIIQSKILTYPEKLYIDTIKNIVEIQINGYGRVSPTNVLSIKKEALEKGLNKSSWDYYVGGSKSGKKDEQYRPTIVVTVEQTMGGSLFYKIETQTGLSSAGASLSGAALNLFKNLKQGDKFGTDLKKIVTPANKAFLTEVFPGLYNRGWSLTSATIGKELTAADEAYYILGVSEDSSPDDINFATSVLKQEWQSYLNKASDDTQKQAARYILQVIDEATGRALKIKQSANK